MRKVSRGLAFLGLFAMGSKKKVKILGGKVRILFQAVPRGQILF